MKQELTQPAHDGADKQSGRRGFLAVAAAGLAGIMIAPGVRLIEIAQAGTAVASPGANPRVRWGMLIDSTRCASGCTDCVHSSTCSNNCCNNHVGCFFTFFCRHISTDTSKCL